jgi:two-component system, cell cycle sensor histidine kinase and response regulator CckA
MRENIADNNSLVYVNPGHINQIVTNLCANAFYAMKEKGGLIEISLEDVSMKKEESFGIEEPYVKLIVSDTGHGMKKEVLERIFDPFFTTKNAGEGTGLGLSAVLGIIKSYNGDIKVKSEPDTGSTFEIFIPRITDEKDVEN